MYRYKWSWLVVVELSIQMVRQSGCRYVNNMKQGRETETRIQGQLQGAPFRPASLYWYWALESQGWFYALGYAEALTWGLIYCLSAVRANNTVTYNWIHHWWYFGMVTNNWIHHWWYYGMVTNNWLHHRWFYDMVTYKW